MPQTRKGTEASHLIEPFPQWSGEGCARGEGSEHLQKAISARTVAQHLSQLRDEEAGLKGWYTKNVNIVS